MRCNVRHMRVPNNAGMHCWRAVCSCWVTIDAAPAVCTLLGAQQLKTHCQPQRQPPSPSSPAPIPSTPPAPLSTFRLFTTLLLASSSIPPVSGFPTST